MEQGCKQNQTQKLLNASKDQLAKRNFKTDGYQGWNQSQSQNHSKRRLLRKGIRQKHVNQIFKHKREKFKYEQGLCSAKTIDSEYQMRQIMGSNGKDRGKGHLLSKKDEINQLLNSEKHIGNDTIWKIWRIVIESNNQICLNQKSMQRLIECAKSDLSFTSNPDCEYSRKKIINQRIGQILWTLLNQTYKSPNISLHTTVDIVQLCLHIVRQAPSAEICPDQYLIGLCIVLLGNICVSQSHVNCILKQVKLSQLLSMVEDTGMLQGENCEDLSFFFTNLLFYYPEYRSQSEKDAQQEIEELTKVLIILGRYLEVDLLLNIYALHRLPIRNNQQANNTPLKKGHHSNTKNKYQQGMENSKKQLQGDIEDEQLKITQEQLEKIKNRLNINNRTLDISKLSQNFTNDLMQCIQKIKQIILDIHISHSISSISAEILSISLHPLVSSLLTNSIRLLLLHPAPLPCSLQLKLHNTLLFIRSELRFISLKNNNQKYNGFEGKLIKNIKDNLMKKGFCERTCEWIKRWVGGNCERYQSNGKEMRIEVNQEMNESIENCVWQIYGKMLEFLSEADYTDTINVHKKCREHLQKQLSWLESQLTSKNKKQRINYGQSMSMADETQGIQQSRIFPLLSEYYPLATIQYQDKKQNLSLFEAAKSMDESSNLRSSYRVRVSDIQLGDCVEYIDVEIGKIADLLQLFCMKLQQYKDCPTILCICLRSTLRLLSRLNNYLSSLQLTLNIGSQPLFLLPPHLQKPLRQIFYTYLSSASDNTISQQICDLIEQILHGKKQQVQIEQEAIEEQREQEVNQDGNTDWKMKYKMEQEKQTNSEEWEKRSSKMQ